MTAALTFERHGYSYLAFLIFLQAMTSIHSMKHEITLHSGRHEISLRS